MRNRIMSGRSGSAESCKLPFARTMIAAGVLGVLSAPSIGYAQEQPSSASQAEVDEQQATSDRTTELDTVYVTSEHRRENLQNIAASVSVRTGDAMRKQGKYSLDEILEDVPGIEGGAALNTGTGGGSGTDMLARGLTIRGIPSNGGAGGSVSSVATAAAIYVDGVYEGVGGGYDLERVEVLRGPQGTLYGRSATSGVVAIHTRNPSLDGFNGQVSMEAGSYSLLRESAALNIPLVSDTLAVRVAVNHSDRDSYDDRRGGEETSAAKLKVLYQPTSNLSILAGVAWEENKTDTEQAFVHTGPDSWVRPDGKPDPGANTHRQYWAQVDWNLGFAKLTYLPAQRTWESWSIIESRSFLSFDQSVETPYDHFTTHELRLSSNPESKIAWQVGALDYSNELRNRNSIVSVGGGFGLVDGQIIQDSRTQRKTDATGIFAEATFPIGESWRLTAGARYDKTKVMTTQTYTATNGETYYLTGEEGTRKFNNFTYKARIEHDLTPQNLIYGMVSTGFTPGDVTVGTGASGGPEVLVLEAETLTAYEFGSKNSFFDNTLLVNGAVYYYDYSAFQTAGINISTNPALSIYATLASPMKAYGAELEVVSRITPNDRLMFSFAYTHARYVDKDKYRLADGTSFADYYANDEVDSVVPIRLNLAYEHDVEFGNGALLSLRGDMGYGSPHDAGDLTPQNVADGYGPYVRVGEKYVGNLSATWTKGRYALTGYVRNVTDNRYKDSVGIGLQQVRLTAPRTIGMVLNVDF